MQYRNAEIAWNCIIIGFSSGRVLQSVVSTRSGAQADGNPSQETPNRRRLHTTRSQYRLISEPLYLLTVCQL
uniref:Uncharacterized protein n=1 Tax=Trichuris muris TaxID=70415 RepID=A0A5S6Q5Z5_TRIMR